MSCGGLRYVKAMGIALEDRGIVQVSMNLTNFEKTPIFRVFEPVKREAARYGVSVLESEIVGLVPAAALAQPADLPAARRLHGRPGARKPARRLSRPRSRRPPRAARSRTRASSCRVAALDAERFRGPRHVALLRGQHRRM